MKKAITSNLIIIIIFLSSKYTNGEEIFRMTVKKSKYYICENLSNYRGSPGVNKNPREFLNRNCKISPNLVGSKICLENTHCKLDKQSLEKYLDLKCLEIYKTKHKQYFVKKLEMNNENIVVTYNCRLE